MSVPNEREFIGENEELYNPTEPCNNTRTSLQLLLNRSYLFHENQTPLSQLSIWIEPSIGGNWQPLTKAE